MSTKALWKALDAAFDHPNADGETCRAARDELRAIEKAAREFSKMNDSEPYDSDALDPLFDISRQEPKT